MRRVSLGLIALMLVVGSLGVDSSTYADSSDDTMTIAQTLADYALISEEAAQQYWESLTPEQQEAVGELIANAVIVPNEEEYFGEVYQSYEINPADGSLMVVDCVTGYSNSYFTWAGIFGGAVNQQSRFCWDPSGFGTITSANCTAGFDYLFPWAFGGYVYDCRVTSGGVGAQHVAYQTQGIFTSTAGTAMYPCTGLTVSAFGSYRSWDC